MNIQPTLADFEAANWQNSISACAEKSCAKYSVLFRQEQDVQHLAGNTTVVALFTRLAVWTGASLSDVNDTPFAAAFLDSIPDGDFLLLRDLARTASDAELQARLADLAWQGRVNNRRDPDMARLAITAYLSASTNFASQWWEEARRIERALRLALGLGRKATESEAVWTFIETRLAQIGGEDDWFLSERLMRLLQEARRGDESTYAPMAERAAQRAMAQRGVGQREKAKRYFEVKAAWHQPQSEEWFEALQMAAETYVAEANDEMSGFYGAPNPIGAAMHLQRAVEAYRAINESDRSASRTTQLHSEMIRINGEAQKIFESRAQTIDLSQFVETAIKHVKGMTALEALQRLVLIQASPRKTDLRAQVDVANDEMVELLRSYEQVNAAGQVVARRPSLLSSDPQQREEATQFEMLRIAGLHRQLIVDSFVVPALWQMHKEHRFSERDWVALIQHSPFVPSDREWLFARGFQAGWEGDWDVATHLLVPQVENSIRHILTQNQVLTSTLRAGVQSEQGLDQTLIKSELIPLLGEDLVFDLRGLLVEKAGGYLRHKTAHGLASFGEFFDDSSIYLWWLTLRLCLLPLISPSPAAKTQKPNEPESL